MLIVKLLLTLPVPAEFDGVTVNEPENATVLLPVITPVELIVNPVGNAGVGTAAVGVPAVEVGVIVIAAPIA